ncbi:hypothetical protein LTR95_015090 [Oleoguttula sp. CCFEE 5521]
MRASLVGNSNIRQQDDGDEGDGSYDEDERKSTAADHGSPRRPESTRASTRGDAKAHPTDYASSADHGDVTSNFSDGLKQRSDEFTTGSISPSMQAQLEYQDDSKYLMYLLSLDVHIKPQDSPRTPKGDSDVDSGVAMNDKSEVDEALGDSNQAKSANEPADDDDKDVGDVKYDNSNNA